MVFGFIPEYRSASLRNQRSASPESSRGIRHTASDYYRSWELRKGLANQIVAIEVHSVIIDNTRLLFRFRNLSSYMDNVIELCRGVID
jgi:hypothetical protein